MPDNQTRNMIMFVILAGAILLGYEFLVIKPMEAKQQAAAAAQAKLHPASPTGAPGAAPGIAPVAVKLTREQALALSPRVPVATPTLAGSIALKGGRFDDLHLKLYK